LHFQPVFFELLRVNRLLRALVLRCVFWTAFATVRTIAAVSATATATAATVAPPTARFVPVLSRRSIAVIRSRVLPLLHGRARLLLLLLLRRTRRTLIRTPFPLRLLSLRLDFALRALRPGLLLVRGPLVAALLLVAPLLAVTLLTITL